MKRLLNALLLIIASLVMCSVSTQAAEIVLNDSEATIFAMNYKDGESDGIPSGYAKSYQISVADPANTTFEVVSGESAVVNSDGLVEAYYNKVPTYFWGSGGSAVVCYMKAGDTVISVTSGDVTEEVTVHVVNYADYYVEKTAREDVAKATNDSMSEYEKMVAITRYIPAHYPYSASHSSAYYLITEGADCWGYTDYLASCLDVLGIKNHSRNANRDSGAGSGHMNNVAMLSDGNMYICDANIGLVEPIGKEGFTYRVSSDGTATLWQYDGFDSDVVVPAEVNGHKVSAIYGQCFSRSYVSIKSLKIEEGVTTLLDGALAGLTELTEINLPASVIDIQGAAISSANIEKINVAEGNPAYKTVDGVLYNSDATVLQFYPPKKTGEIIFPDTVTEIGGGAFANSEITSIKLPNKITKIGMGAFKYCTSLESIEIPDTVTEIEMEAFYDCTALKSINLPSGLTSLGEGVLAYCYSLTEVEVPEGITAVPDHLFFADSSLEKITFKGKITDIGEGVFKDVQMTEFVIPDGITSIKNATFYGCDKLEKITIPDSVNEIGSEAFRGCSSLKEIKLPNGITRINSNCFVGCTGLEEIDIPNTVTRIGSNAFASCFGIKTLIIPDSVTNIDFAAFYNMQELRFVKLPADLTTLQESVFQNCISLNSIQAGDKLASISVNVFKGCNALNGIYVSSDKIKADYEKLFESASDEVNISAKVKVSKNGIVKFDINGGNGTVGNVSSVDGRLEIPAYDISRLGYEFIGWSAVKDSEVGSFIAGDTYICDGDITLYAIWKPIEYKLVMHLYGKTNYYGYEYYRFYTEDVMVKYDEAFELPITDREHYTLLGYSMTEDSDTVEYGVGDSIVNLSQTAGEEIHIYQVWDPNDVVITLDPNGGTGGPGRQIKKYGIETLITDEVPTLEGKMCIGWSTEKDSKYADYRSGSYYWGNEDVTLYAVWDTAIYKVNYNLNGSLSGGFYEQSKVYGSSITLNSNKPSRSSYEFLGWGLDADATTPVYQPGDEYTEEKSVTLYAIWKKLEYTVAYDANGGTNAPEAQIKIFGENLTLTADKPQRSGYTFLGWARSKTSVIASYQPGDTFTPNMNITLYAIWSDKHEHVIVDDAAVAPTCTEDGKTAGTHCSDCGEVFTAQETIKAKGHTVVVDKAVAATTTSTGLTEGSHCSVCNTVINAQTVIPKLDSKPGTQEQTKPETKPETTPGTQEQTKPETKPEEKPAITSNPFRDVKNGKYYTDSILYLNERGVMTGLNATTFGFGRLLLREDMVVLIWKNEGKPSMNVKANVFKDVKPGKYYTDAVAWAKKNNVVGGYTSGAKAGYFGKGDNITRQDFIKIIYGYAAYKGYNTKVKSASTYLEKADASKVSKYAREAVNWGYENGFIGNGSPLNPKNNITRQDAAVIIARFLKAFDK